MEFPAGVLTDTFADPGAVIKSLGIATCSCVLLWTVVVNVVPLITTTEDETNFLPVTVRTNPCCAWARVIVVLDSETIAGAGRALPHKGLSALQPGRRSRAIPIANNGHRMERT